MGLYALQEGSSYTIVGLFSHIPPVRGYIIPCRSMFHLVRGYHITSPPGGIHIIALEGSMLYH